VEQVSRTFGLHSEKEVYTHFTTKNPIKDQDSSLAFFPHPEEAALEEVEVGTAVLPEVAEEIGNQARFYV
jgi:hypothetical protein